MNFSYTPLSSPNPKPPISDATSRAGAGEREHMFEKVVTPSDVGKLNRLVIPKQHAEKYFPLDSAAGEKGLLLNFDEIGESGKSWRFRYSYWSSSQSYVITKGWSRFVKDKHLDAGDVVSFSRVSADDTHRHFIDWRRRPVNSASRFDQVHHGISVNRPPWCYSTVGMVHGIPPPFLPPYRRPDRHDLINNYGGGFTANNFGVINPNYCCVHHHGSVVCFGMGGNCEAGSPAGVGPMVFESVPVVKENAAPKRLRLFGVNMDCVTSADHDLLNRISSPSSSNSLQLRLHGGDPSSSANRVTIKGKSAVSLDFHI